MRIDGRVRGNLNGFIDAEVHGLFSGNLSALVEFNSVTDTESETAVLPKNSESGNTDSEGIQP